jgi:hypothetical protein
MNAMMMTLTMEIVPNPDRRDHRGSVKPVTLTAKVPSLKAAVAAMQQVIEEYGLGGGNIGNCPVTLASGFELCRISYNGRCWSKAGIEIVPA